MQTVNSRDGTTIAYDRHSQGPPLIMVVCAFNTRSTTAPWLAGAPLVLMHGFPDNTHLYDRLLPHLAGRRVVRFDFLGWGPLGQAAGLRVPSRST